MEAERERYLAERRGLQRMAALSQTMKSLGHDEAIEDKKKVNKEIMSEIFTEVKKPQFFNDPKIKAKI